MEHELFNAIESQNGKRSNGEEDGETKTIHHSHEGDVKNGGVFVMDEENGSTVEFNIELDGCLLGSVLIASEATIHKSESRTHSPEDKEFTHRPVNIKHHSTNKGNTDIVEPLCIEIWLTSLS